MTSESGERQIAQVEARELSSVKTIIPVFGAHFVGKRAETQIQTLIENTRNNRFPETASVWSESDLNTVRKFHPSVIGVDGLSSDDKTEILAYNPGNPFSLRSESPTQKDTFLVGAEIRRDFSDVSNHLVSAIKKAKIQTLSSALTTQELSKITIPDLGILAALFAISRLPGTPGVLGDLATILYGSGIVANFVEKRLHGVGSAFEKLTRPLGERLGPRDVIFRNALIAVKTIDAAKSLKEKVHDGPLVNLLGGAHHRGNDVWKNQKDREKVLERNFTRILRIYKRMHEKNPTAVPLSEDDIARLIHDSIVSFGETTIWRIMERPQGEPLDLQIAKQALPVEKRFYSPTIRRLVLKAAEKTFPGYTEEKYIQKEKPQE